MKIDHARAIVDAGRELGCDMEVSEGYSGRGMFGEETAAVIYDDESGFLEAVQMAAQDVGVIEGMRFDDLGKGRVAY